MNVKLCCVSKNVITLFCYNFDIHESILIIFARIAKQSKQSKDTFLFQPHLTSASALPGKTQKHKIASFHSNALLLHWQTSVSCWLNLFVRVTRNYTYAAVRLPKSCSQWN